MISASSCSNFIRAPRPYPARRRASAAATSAVLICTPAGIPSQIATSACPCDSPAVSQRNMQPILVSPAPPQRHRAAGALMIAAAFRGLERTGNLRDHAVRLGDGDGQAAAETGAQAGEDVGAQLLRCPRWCARGQRELDGEIRALAARVAS